MNDALAKRNQRAGEALAWLAQRGYRKALVLDHENFALHKGADGFSRAVSSHTGFGTSCSSGRFRPHEKKWDARGGHASAGLLSVKTVRAAERCCCFGSTEAAANGSIMPPSRAEGSDCLRPPAQTSHSTSIVKRCQSKRQPSAGAMRLCCKLGVPMPDQYA